MKREEYACTACRYRSGRWTGFCPQCRAAGTIVEAEVGARDVPEIRAIKDIRGDASARVPTGMGEIDRVLGGGLVPGGVVLLGGEPGVGKSTLLLQVAGAVARAGGSVLVATAEESADQVAIRAERVGAGVDGVAVLADGDVDRIIRASADIRPDLVIVDSIQTVSTLDVDGSPGGVAQVRECGGRLVATAKRFGIPTVLIGHVTKDGAIAGPRVLEHTVDVVLYLEGDDGRGLRFVRGLKNRFGAVHQLGFLEMSEAGLREVPDPTEILLAGWSGDVPGSVVFPALEGRRPVLVEVQALVAPATTTPARRSAKGFETTRLHQLLAVLERHIGAALATSEVYVSVVGGIRIREPAIDLAVAVAVMSSWLGRSVNGTVAWGEVGLTGELRSVGQSARRREEATRLGFTRILAPEQDPIHLGEALARVGLAMPRAVRTA
jgi:DNA repair protein RadA/Sms